MSTASSPKHNRNERHLQRQRGAGARNLTTSFGFILGLPLDLPAQSVADQSHATEPPTKRRKVCREGVKESGDAVGHAQVPAAKEEGTRKLQSKPSSRPRRRVNLLPEEKDALPELQKDESFVETRSVVRKRGRPKKACARDEFTVTDEMAIAPALPAVVADNEEAPPQIKKRRGRPRKTVVSGTNEEPLVARDEFAKTQPALPARKRGRPRKLVVTAANNPVLDQSSTSVKTEELTAGHFTTVPPPPENLQPAATERLAARPRRQAATSAISKMLDVFIEEELPVDSKRRDPTPEHSKKRQRRNAPSTNASNQLNTADSSCKIHEETAGAERGLQDSERVWQATATESSAPTRKPLAAAEVNAMVMQARSSEAPEEESGPKQRRRKHLVCATGKENGQKQTQIMKAPAALLGAETSTRIDNFSSASLARRSTAGEIGHLVAESEGAEPMDHPDIAATSSVADSTSGKAVSDGDAAQDSRAGVEPGSDAEGAQVSSEQRNLVSTQNDKAIVPGAGYKQSSLSNAASSAASRRLSSSRREANRRLELPCKHHSNEQDVDQGNVLLGTERASLRRATKSKRRRSSLGGDDESEMDLDEMLSSIATYAANKHRCQVASKRNASHRI